MSSTDWGHVDSNADALTESVTSPDLFGGELFGDELMDMYNSAEEVGHDMMHSEIPSLLGAAAEHDAAAKNNLEANHPGAHMALAAAAMDDGFGTFRPSTSFNDLSSLLTTEAAVAVVPPVTGPTAKASKPAPKKAAGKKRAAGESATARGSDGPATKKRGIGQKGRVSAAGTTSARRGSSTTKAGKAAAARTVARLGPQSAGQAALKLRKEQRALLNSRVTKGANGTPNPLADSIALRAPLSKAASKIKPASVPSAANVTPRPSVTGKGDSITSDAAAATAAAAAAVAAAAAAAAVTAPTSGSSRGVTTEADFKSVAQAAVTNLILNAGTSSLKPDAAPSSVPGSSRPEADVFTGKIDTSTAHIKALTSSNWVNACGGSDESVGNVPGVDSKANNRARRQNLTPDERARQNRDRNREHARNTRLRKKAYVEELKRTLTELVSQRDAAELEKRHAAQREMEQREVRFRVMEEFLKLRGRSETNSARWVAILEDNFCLTLPRTEYRKMVHSDSLRRNPGTTEQLLRGANEVMTDASFLASFMRTLTKDSNPQAPKAAVTLQHHCERKAFFMDGSTAVLDWSATAVGAMNQGSTVKFSFKGIMRAKFSPASNKLISAELVFDAGNVASQVVNHLMVHTSTDACDEVAAAAAAAQVAANEADALLDSLQMPHLDMVPAAITLLPHSTTAVSVTSSEKEDGSSDESTAEACENTSSLAKRRSTRVKD